jgi:hypothetical protein
MISFRVVLYIDVKAPQGCKIIPEKEIDIFDKAFSSFGSIFCIVLACLIILYFIVGIPINV